MKCSNCGEDVKESSERCLICGAPVKFIDEATQNNESKATAISATQTEVASGSAPYEKPTNSKSAEMGAAITPQFFDDNLTPIVSVGNWLLSLILLTLVPLAVLVIVGIIVSYIDNALVSNILGIIAAFTWFIMMLIWAFNKRVNPSKRNFFRAAIIYTIIIVVIVVILTLVLAPFVLDFLEGLGFSQLDWLNGSI